MKIYLLLAHPDKNSFNGQIADAYYTSAIEKGHTVRYQKLAEMTFDPILRKGYQVEQTLESDLIAAQQNILWCDKWVIIYPVWWGNLPALLKGFIDRTLTPGFAFNYHDKDPFWDKLLKGRTAELIATSDAPGWWIWWQYRNSDVHALKHATLNYCGFEHISVRRITRVRFLSKVQRKQKIKEICDRITQATELVHDQHRSSPVLP
ncbi:NAD(P)H-dependent oxidoreductase [Spirosoma aureum]|uniref:NAD(P)H-dependent oxidoreductase n=1 Tax=Spirosoma aureum TaxID=2692134 RepID=A0A6G9AS28_9BACT|nr:NAD(P)H-dependent oxidoreductase [Spirosoma aureum]QIP15136.1 NAD(P)H-dependent oxidoreductase [Spirosoma aureum]